ncbi:Inactive peptidyl-prolyl cis-trans isomerase fkbp6 [Mactra antiquata]
MDKEEIQEEENPTVTLADAIDLNDLRKPESQGVFFEVKEQTNDLDDVLHGEQTDNTCYDPDELCKNLYRGDESDSNDEDEDDERTHFEQLAAKMTDISPDKDGGVLKQILHHGSGSVIPDGAMAWTHYNAYFEYADEPFDSTRLRDQPKKFRLGHGDCVAGFDIAVSSMKKGEVARFLLGSEYYFGPVGSTPRIPSDATALFEIELLNFVEQAGLNDYFSMTEEEKRNVPFTDVVKLYHTIANEAKHYFQEGRIRQAVTKYRKASQLLEERRLKDEAEEKEQRKLLLRVYINLALCCIKLAHSGRAIGYCRQSLDIEKNNAKALYLNGRALHQLGEYERAISCLKRAQRIKPGNREINEEMEKVEKDIAKFRMLEKDMYSKMFSTSTPDTNEENKDGEREEKAKSKCMECSDKFKVLVNEKMQEFIGDKELMEMPLPSYNLTIGEIECIIETAESLDLDYKVKGEGSQKQIKILKKHPEIIK